MVAGVWLKWEAKTARGRVRGVDGWGEWTSVGGPVNLRLSRSAWTGGARRVKRQEVSLPHTLSLSHTHTYAHTHTMVGSVLAFSQPFSALFYVRI